MGASFCMKLAPATYKGFPKIFRTTEKVKARKMSKQGGGQGGRKRGEVSWSEASERWED